MTKVANEIFRVIPEGVTELECSFTYQLHVSIPRGRVLRSAPIAGSGVRPDFGSRGSKIDCPLPREPGSSSAHPTTA
ncbi:hypothetical protein EVAR_103763_1 [Eumeta japonica]|uniref:Uncharacterized protein n=1 Tax=Eumeta variegata TaxID=151549 RepID=A0A4C2A5N8_EUMVA|nr:hypothetical protein EVAR_103763_1 [Eumeta japonica]